LGRGYCIYHIDTELEMYSKCYVNLVYCITCLYLFCVFLNCAFWHQTLFGTPHCV
jgi:hypothetical protein